MTALAGLSWPEVGRLADAGVLLLVPVGSTEQHGPHLPVTTDTDIAIAVATAAAERLDGAVVAPSVAYGSSGEHSGFPGTLSIGQEATERLLVELGRSATSRFTSVIVVSTHGGNAGPVGRAVSMLRSEGRDARAWWPRWDGDAHAGRTETALMLAIAPERVRMDAAAAGNTRSIGDLLPMLRAGGVQSVSGNGVLGDPTGATAEEGRTLLATAVDTLVQLAERPRSATNQAAIE